MSRFEHESEYCNDSVDAINAVRCPILFVSGLQVMLSCDPAIKVVYFCETDSRNSRLR